MADARDFDLTGKRFGKLLVTGFDRYEAGASWWQCKCDCGREKTVNRKYLMNGHTASCRCLRGVRGQYDPAKFARRAIPEAAEEWIIAHYKHTRNDEIKAKFGISDGALHRFARKHGLKKTAQFRKKCQKNASDAAARSHLAHGTYPAKGHRIPRSEEFQFRAGQKIARSPEEIARRTETRKRTIAEDRARVLFGLPQKTKVKVTKQPRKKISQRSYLRKLGYIVARGSDTAYFTPDTRRSMAIENRKFGDKDYQYFEYKAYEIDQ